MNDFFYKNLDAYKAAKEFTLYVYSLIKKFPAYEQFALCDQLRRAAVSIPSNLAEGMGRMAIKERLHFIDITNGSLIEVLCQLDISQSLGYISNEDLEQAEAKASHYSRVASGLRKYLTEKLPPQE